jgi:hypothetical protein
MLEKPVLDEKIIPNSGSSNIEFDNERKDICWKYWNLLPTWRISYFFTDIRGCENLHLYMWIVKDWSWMQGWNVCGVLFGSMAIIWMAYLFYWAVRSRNLNEIWTSISLFLWLFANMWW